MAEDAFFRLVTVRPGNFDDAIECELVAFNAAQSSQPYEALSYVWGDPANTVPITLNQRDFPVTVNLERALRYLRRQDVERVLWIDAICINQHDNDEKGAQVRAMGQRYSQSSGVLIWLGEEIDPLVGPLPMSTPEIFEVLSRLAKEEDVTELIGADPWERWTPSLLGFLKRAWFSRLWIVQETALARDPLMICGECSIRWVTFLNAYLRILQTLVYTANGEQLLKAAFFNIDALSKCWSLHQLWKDRPAPPSKEEFSERVIQLLFTLGGLFNCSDERDRINGILGILEAPTLSPMIAASYEDSAATVFNNLAVFLLKSRGSLDFLAGDRANFDSSGYPGKPSWVPTWKSFTTYHRGHYPWPSGWGTDKLTRSEMTWLATYRFSEDKNILYVNGTVIGDRVGVATPAPYFPSESSERRKALSQALLMWETEVVHLPLLRARGDMDTHDKACKEMSMWETGVVPLPSLSASYASEKETIDRFRQAIFHPKQHGAAIFSEDAHRSRNPQITEQQVYEALLGRADYATADKDDLEREAEMFASYKWPELHDMAPFLLSSGQFGIYEADTEIYQGDILVALLTGGPGPVALRVEGRCLRYLGPCYVQGLEDTDSWLEFFTRSEIVQFPLI